MSIFRLVSLASLACGVLFAAPDEPKKPVPKFKLGKDTTYIDGPLDKDGYLDYETALNERLKGKTTPETNAVVLLLKCFGPKPEGSDLKPDFYKALGIDAPPEKGDYLVSHGKHFQDEIRGDDSQAFFDLEARLRKQPWKPADSPKHAEWIKLNEKPLAVAIEASRCKDYFHPLIARDKDGKRGMLVGAFLPTVQKSRELASILSVRATLKLGDGKIDDAFADALAMHRLARLVARGGTLIESLIGIAIQAIAHNTELAIFEHGQPTAKQALDYRDELLKLAPMPTVADKLQLSERFTFLDAVQSSRREGFDIVTMEKPKTQEEIDTMADFLDWETIFRLGNKWYDKMAVALRKPTRSDRVAASAELDKELRKFDAELKDRGPLKKLIRRGAPDEVRLKVSESAGMGYVSLLFPAIQKLADAGDRSEQLHSNGIIAAGLAAHFADTKKYPDKLADLMPKYLDKVPDDTFSGKPPIYHKTKSGYLCYSVGVNGEDDGGQLLSEVPRGDDIGVRMPRR